MTHLLDLTVAAHGGLDRFNQLKTLSVHDSLSGALWSLKGQEGTLKEVRLAVDGPALRKEPSSRTCP